MSELQDRIDNAVEELREWANDNPGYDPDEIISELADSGVPVYTYDILQCAMDDINLAVDEPELGPAFDGSPTPTNIIAANIYEKLESALWEAWREIEDEREEESEDEVEEDNDPITADDCLRFIVMDLGFALKFELEGNDQRSKIWCEIAEGYANDYNSLI